MKASFEMLSNNLLSSLSLMEESKLQLSQAQDRRSFSEKYRQMPPKILFERYLHILMPSPSALSEVRLEIPGEILVGAITNSNTICFFFLSFLYRFVTMESESDAKDTLLDLKLKKRTYAGVAVKARLKSEPSVRSYFTAVPMIPIVPVMGYAQPASMGYGSGYGGGEMARKRGRSNEHSSVDGRSDGGPSTDGDGTDGPRRDSRGDGRVS
jgi:hypothetical protein